MKKPQSFKNTILKKSKPKEKVIIPQYKKLSTFNIIYNIIKLPI